MCRIGARIAAVLAAICVASVSLSGVQAANAATGRLLQPDEVYPIAAGLVDATGSLGVQCGMSKLGQSLRGSTPLTQVASGAVKASLAVAKAKNGCSAAIEVLKAVAAMVALAELNQPTWVSLDQSVKERLGPIPDECKVVIRTGPSEARALKFTAKFTC